MQRLQQPEVATDLGGIVGSLDQEGAASGAGPRLRVDPGQDERFRGVRVEDVGDAHVTGDALIGISAAAGRARIGRVSGAFLLV